MSDVGSTVEVAGLVLAAGRGRRMGRPKVLMRHPNGAGFLDSAVSALVDGGCNEVVVVVGAAGAAARGEMSPELAVLERRRRLHFHQLSDWSAGIGSSLVAGLGVLPRHAQAVAIMLVDLPDVDARVVRRVLDLASPNVLARATYAGRPGHPVLVGRIHWTGIQDEATDREGAKAYLDNRGALPIPCDDLATGRDVDRPEDLL